MGCPGCAFPEVLGGGLTPPLPPETLALGLVKGEIRPYYRVGLRPPLRLRRCEKEGGMLSSQVGIVPGTSGIIRSRPATG